MQYRRPSKRLLPWLLSCALGVAVALGAPVVETPAERVAVFHASPEARDAALPSAALIVPRRGPEGDGGATLRPVFAADGARQVVTVAVPAGTALYGTGEVSGPLLRNGRTVTLWNSDVYGYDSRTPALYQSHPWVLGVRADGTAFGLIFDSTYRQTIALPPLSGGDIRVEAEGPAFPVVVIERDTPAQVVQELATLTGLPPLPPKWALGYQQSRWSYSPDTRVREIAREFRARRIPCDVLWLDIDYMEDFRIFTVDPRRFPDPNALNAELHAQGFRTVWMIDPGLKSDEAAPTQPPTPANATADTPEQAAVRAAVRERFAALREEGRRGRYYVQRGDGSDYEGEVWPGRCYFPDFTRAAVRGWWAGLYAPFLAQGVDGVWNDMNEPAVFNVASKTVPEDAVHHADPELGGTGPHARYHNIYGMQMIRATREGLTAARPDRRPFVLSRANFLGGQRYGATWTGDNTANWEQLAWSVPMALNLGLSGQPFTGPDIGGYVGDGPDGASPRDCGTHFARWMGVGTLLPFARAHTNKTNADKEPWAFGAEVERTCRTAIERRYRLMPYLYTLFREAATSGMPVVRPVFFADPRDPALRAEDRAFLLGGDLLVSCNLTPERDDAATIPAGWAKVRLPGETCDDPDLPELYLRPGAAVPTGPVMQFVDERPLDRVTLLVYLDARGEASGTLYEDAGDGYGYRSGEYRLTTFHVAQRDGKVALTTSHKGDWLEPAGRSVEVVVVGGDDGR
jgi:alpha-glucosidase